MMEGVRRLLRLYSHLLIKYKYTTQIVTGGILWGSGDVLCQTLVQAATYCGQEGKAQERIKVEDRRPFRIDWQRTARMTFYGVTLSAPAYAFWYSFLERLSLRIFAAPAPGISMALQTRLKQGATRDSWLLGPIRQLLMGHKARATLRTWKIIGFKLAMDTILFDPAYLSLFFTASGLLEGASMEEISSKLRADLLHTWLVDVAVWFPIQTLNFRFVPVLYQALIVQSCNIGWNAYLSFVQHEHPVA